jgi:hypothetical protein
VVVAEKIEEEKKKLGKTGKRNYVHRQTNKRNELKEKHRRSQVSLNVQTQSNRMRDRVNLGYETHI